MSSRDRATNEKLLEYVVIPSIVTLICQHCPRWLGYLTRMDDSLIPRKFFARAVF
uniref:Uncharacterized protein n=1 Tax=Arion vulgaris TaxID=1028688 RepID=A0A0B7BAA1_9EUPU